VNTNGYGGRKLSKSIQVETNDPKKKSFNLMITGYVEKFATITPPRVSLLGEPGMPIKSSVRIIPEKKYPFKIQSVNIKEGVNIRHELKEETFKEGKGYLLTVENLQSNAGPYFDIITLKTDSPIRPEIQISVYGNIAPKKE